MTLAHYLVKYYQPSTQKIYGFEIEHYIKWMGQKSAELATHTEVLAYLEYLRGRYEKAASIRRIMHAVKCYYHFLQATEQRIDHPCLHLRLRDVGRFDVQVQDLLTEAELKGLLIRKERFAAYALRNQVIMSLLVYQALLIKEMVGLLVQDVALEQGTIYVRQTIKTNSRTLALQPDQIMIFYRYLNEVRPKLIKQETEALIITGRGTAERGEGIHYLVSTYRKQLPEKKLTPTTIRQSVIALKLKNGQDLRRVQLFAGHRKVSSTEQYRTTNLEELKTAVAKYHPLQ